MKYEQLKLIDFSQGIRSSEVMHNDIALQEQIERERLAIAGYGINFGLDLSLTDDFKLTVDNGTIVDKEGVEQYIKTKSFTIEKPNLIAKRQRLFATENGIIELEEIPYANSQLMPSEYVMNSDDWGITAYYEDSPSSHVNISSIKDKTLYTDAKNAKRAIIVTYSAAYDRIDTVYINNDYELKISAGIDSTTPSAYITNDCKYVLGFVEVVSHYFDKDTNKTFAKASIIKKFDNRRTVYTDRENNLYLCGIPFESLLKIYFKEPENPKEGMLWYDMTTNKLKIWRRTDHFMFTDVIDYTSIDPNNPRKFNTSVGYYKGQLSVYIENANQAEDGKVWTKLADDQLEYYTDLQESEKGTMESKQFRIIPALVSGTKIKYTINRYDGSYYWVPINDTSYVSTFEYKLWAADKSGKGLVEYLPGLNLDEMKEERPDHDLKHFLFRSDELHLRFTPYKNELSVMIDQIPLHRDQFAEITLDDVLKDKDLMELATTHYGYSTAYLQDLKNTYQNIGLGFKFINKLDHPSFIEVNIQHRVNDSILKNKFQRNASFTKSQTITYNGAKTSRYRTVQQNIEIDTDIPYKLGEEQLEVFVNGLRVKKELITEITTGEELLGATCRKFSINPAELSLNSGDEITYKITTNVYSYDHVESAIKEFQQELVDKVADLEAMIRKMQKRIDVIQGY